MGIVRCACDSNNKLNYDTRISKTVRVCVVYFFVVAILCRTKVVRLIVIGPFLSNLRILNLETSHNYLMASMCALVPDKTATKGKGWHAT